MKTLIKSLKVLALVAVLISGNRVFAQDKSEHGQHKEMSKEKKEARFAEASKKLSLTADQQTRIKAILEQNKQEMKTLREANKDKAKEEKRNAMVQQMKKTDAKVVAVLDTKQQEIYKQMKAEKKAKMQQRKEDRVKMEEELEDVGIGVF